MAIAGDHDVVRLEITMHNPGCVSLCQTFGGVLQITKKLRQIGLTAMYYFAQRGSLNELHRNEVRAIVITNLMNCRDVRVIKRRGCRGFLLEAAHAISICTKIGREYFQSDSTVQPC